MKTASGIMTFVLLLGAGCGLFFFLLLALNGFSEREANPAIVFYSIWILFFAVVFGVASFFIAKFLLAKSFNAILALTLSIVVAGGIGALINFGGLIISTLMASEIRNSYIKK